MRPITPADLWAMRRVGDPVIAAGRGAVVAVTTHDIEENKARDQLFLVPDDGGEPRPLTAPELSSRAPAVSADGRTLAFLRKPAGKEGGEPQVHVMPLDGGEARCVTDLPLGA